MTTTLIVPGLNGSGPDHWQNWFELHVADCIRVIQSDWKTPHLATWSHAVSRDLRRSPGRVFLVAHSFGVLAAADSAIRFPERIAGAMLVAPADPKKFHFDSQILRHRLSFPSLLVASRNDKWMSFERAHRWAETWGSQLIDAGHAGHINAKSGYGPWPEGISLYEKLRTPVSHSGAFRRNDDILLELGEI